MEYRELKWCFLISTDTSVCQIVVKVLLRKLGIVENISLNWKHFKSNCDHNVLLSFAHKSTEEGIKGYLMNVMHLVKNSSLNLVTYLVNRQRGWLLSLSLSKKGVTCFWHFLASDFHETFTRSSLALNMRRKLLSDPLLAVHGKIMANNSHFFHERAG